MKCFQCNIKEAVINSCFCEDCKKEKDRDWKTCRICGIFDNDNLKHNYVINSICRDCREKKENKEDFDEACINGEITRDNNIMCPYCGNVNEDSWEYNDCDKYTCGNCDRTSELSVEYTTHYTTKKKEVKE